MKVVAINGSPRPNGNTSHAIRIVTAELETLGIRVEQIQIGNTSIRGCLACGSCAKNKNERCIIDDEVNEYIQVMKEADGILIASPVYFSGIAGTMKCFLDRAFYVAGANGGLFRHKAGAALVAVRRSGGSATFQQLNAYLLYAEMLIPASNYWNIIHGAAPAEVLQDEEGCQTLRMLGRNLAWLLSMRQQGLQQGLQHPYPRNQRGVEQQSNQKAQEDFVQIPEPAAEPKIRTNFIR
ncbi:MAG: flavodoxin family protein [Termitinemataceae bacterium]